MKTRTPTVPLALLLAVLATAGLPACKSTASLQSNTLDREIIVDGREQEWQGAIRPIEKQNISVGLLNDDAFLYITVIANEPDKARQMLAQGFTVWFDPSGGKERVRGIRFPVGGRQGQGRQRSAGNTPGQRPEAGQDRRRPQGEPGRQQGQRLATALTEMEILDGAAPARRLPVDGLPGVRVQATMQQGLFVYELKVPLQPDADHPFAVGARPGDAIGLGLETPEVDLRAQQGQRGRLGSNGGGRGGFGGRGAQGRSGAGRSGGRSGQPQLPERLKIWVNVELAGRP